MSWIRKQRPLLFVNWKNSDILQYKAVWKSARKKVQNLFSINTKQQITAVQKYLLKIVQLC